LIYRSSRIINFAQGDLGGVPASFGVLLMLGPGVPFVLALPVALVAAIVLGAFVEFALLRRFFKAPRLILTVVTIGLSQLLAGLTAVMPNIFDLKTAGVSYKPPIALSFSVGPTRFDGNEVIAMIAVPIVIGALTWFLRSTSYGIAIRASAESSDRAALLGVPVKRVQTLVWIIATVLSTVGIFLRAGILGLPIGSVLGPTILIRALTAAIIGRMERLPTIFVASVALGVLETTVIYSELNASSAKVDAILFFVVLGALVFQRQGRTARGDETSTWQAARNIRPIPRELISLPEVRWGMRGAGAVLLLVLVLLPTFLSGARVSLAATIVCICIVTVSLVVLTGWAGQVSLGQVGFMGIGAAVASWLTVTWDWDLAVVILACGLVGAAAATLIGLPALRIRGLFLGVATFAFAIAVSSYLLNQSYVHWLPEGRIPRNAILGRIAIDTEARYYYLCLACLLLAIAMVRGIRNSRAGRVLIGVRDNERGAQAYGINVITAKLTAFAVSGFLAAAAGALFVHGQQSLGIQPYAPARSFQVFILVVIGGLGSIPGALLGPVVIEGLEYFRSVFPETIRNILFFLTTGLGLLAILLFLPGGFGQVYYAARDRILRAIAERRGIHVPSLVADSRTEEVAPSIEDASVPEVATEQIEAAIGADL
ncbi:MAG: branched-chain amino acid transport system permease protein livM, partial [Actinomycetota bacterium]|nr:branched-chain amino acid transport system permease protein livM [Actinomycetota bacterium]